VLGRAVLLPRGRGAMPGSPNARLAQSPNGLCHLVWAFLFFDVPTSERSPLGSTKHMLGACAWTRGVVTARSRSDAGIA
jgi:hypothetical protein